MLVLLASGTFPDSRVRLGFPLSAATRSWPGLVDQVEFSL